MEFHEVVWGREPLTELLSLSLSEEALPLLPDADRMESNIREIESWLREGFSGLSKSAPNLVSIQLGDAPELLSVEAYQLVNGQASADEVLNQVSEDEWEWLDDEGIVDFDAIESLSYHLVSELPNPPYDMDTYEDDVEGELAYDDREAVWGTMVLFALRALVHDPLLGQLLTQGQTAIPVFVGFEDAPELVAVLTPGGFRQPFA
jgi:hypothetical protein